MYLHKELETLTRPEIEKLQLERLQKTVRHCMNSPFYKQRFAESHLSPEDIRSLDDLQKKFRLLPNKIYVIPIPSDWHPYLWKKPSDPSLIQWNHRKSHCHSPYSKRP